MYVFFSIFQIYCHFGGDIYGQNEELVTTKDRKWSLAVKV